MSKMQHFISIVFDSTGNWPYDNEPSHTTSHLRTRDLTAELMVQADNATDCI